jgi:hypothetical protein
VGAQKEGCSVQEGPGERNKPLPATPLSPAVLRPWERGASGWQTLMSVTVPQPMSHRTRAEGRGRNGTHFPQKGGVHVWVTLPHLDPRGCEWVSVSECERGLGVPDIQVVPFYPLLPFLGVKVHI